MKTRRLTFLSKLCMTFFCAIILVYLAQANSFAYSLKSNTLCSSGGSCNSTTYKLTRSALGGDLTDIVNGTSIILKAGFIVVANAQTNNNSTPPNPPTVNAVTTPTNNPTQALSGTKDANTSTWINGTQVVPLDALTTWSCNHNLIEEQNNLNISCRNSSGGQSTSVPVSIFLDTSPPSIPTVVDEGSTTVDLTQIYASWSSSDPQTNISEYQYLIGTTPNGVDIVPLTSVGISTSVRKTGLNLNPGQVYYVSVKAKNGAGGYSSLGTSDGIYGKNAEPNVTDIGLTEGGKYHGSTMPLTVSVTDPDNISFQYQYSMARLNSDRFRLKSFTFSGGGGTSNQGNYKIKEGTIAETIGAEAQIVGYKVNAGYIHVYKKMLELLNQTPATVLQAWTTSNTYGIVMDNEPPGLKLVTVQVKDSHGGQTSKQIEIFVYRRPISPPQP